MKTKYFVSFLTRINGFSIMKIFKQSLLFLSRNIYYFLIIPLTTLLILILLAKYSENDGDDLRTLLSTIISVSSITTAILITYLFNKVFSERNVRIEQKKRVDEYAIKINLLRQLLFRICQHGDLWNTDCGRINEIVNRKYPDLNLEIYRGQDPVKKLAYDKFLEVDRDICSTVGQAYLAMKGYFDGDNHLWDYKDSNTRNYTLDDIARYSEYSHYIWSTLDDSIGNGTLFNANLLNEYFFKGIQECYQKITGRSLSKDEFKVQLRDLMTEFDENVFPRHYYFNRLLQNKFPLAYIKMFVNVCVNVGIVVASLLLSLVKFGSIDFVANLIVTIFIVNIVDLIVILHHGIIDELSVDDLYAM